MIIEKIMIQRQQKRLSEFFQHQKQGVLLYKLTGPLEEREISPDPDDVQINVPLQNMALKEILNLEFRESQPLNYDDCSSLHNLKFKVYKE